MKNKGFTVFELLASFLIISVILYFMTSTVLDIKDTRSKEVLEYEVESYAFQVLQELQKDIRANEIQGTASCGINCFDIDYGTEEIQFKINTGGTGFTYDGRTYLLPSDTYIDNPGIDETITCDSTDTNKCIYKLYIPVKHKELDETFDIGFIYQYDSSELTLASNAFSNASAGEIPVISLIGGNPLQWELGVSWSDPGGTVSDTEDGIIPWGNVVIGGDTVDVNVEGTYTITYDVEDSQGNDAIRVTRDVDVIQFIYNFAYTGGAQGFPVPYDGVYKIELWGAQGGGSGGKGAYTSGTIHLATTDSVYFYVGGTTSTGSGGYNGGGNVTGNVYGGGGATDMKLGGIATANRIMVAAGGGGKGNGHAGGYGGGPNGGNGAGEDYGSGATQSSGGDGGSHGSCDGGNGGLGYGGSGSWYDEPLGGGGGGYYGGGSGGGCNSNGGGGGGSSYISGSFSSTTMTAGNGSMPIPAGGTETGHSGHGYARATLISVD